MTIMTMISRGNI